ncbi:MAG TPA: outer membrane protein assembly factor BamD [Chitinophagales bacterium]|nr:outer membrane protein assembly factor BamD [Chitinophagales bacterium]HNE45441.1 outer membrane protein assembly factor BamD [Chitinophagales bacterium]HNF70490.1 outer membrane protein assembly factor BamD [Chitinophagales bacterium]
MAWTRALALTIISISILVFTGCQYDKLLKSDDFDAKYAKAKEYYGKGDYARALPLLEQMLSVKIGTPEEKEVRYYTAYCYYGQADYFSSSSLFRQVFNIFPLSGEAEEMLFMSAKSMYMASPRYNLDQQYTYSAIEAFQYFVDVFPKSALVPEANKYMDELRGKLETKLINAAELYYNTEHYESAAITFKNVLLEFPDTRDAEEISYKIADSYFQYAGQSVICKKEERYDDAINSGQDFIQRYPNSPKVADAKDLIEKSIDLKEKAITEITTYKIKCDELSEEN